MVGILVSLLFLIQGIPVQQGGTVSGVLRDSQGMPVAGVRMAAVARGESVEDAAIGAAMAGLAETDEQGRFTLENIPPGRYSIAAGRLDLQTYYPGTQSLADATILTIAGGSTLSGINFALNNTSFGRASGIGSSTPNITAMIPVKVVGENGGKLPVSAGGKLVSIRLESPSSTWTIPIDGPGFTVPGPVAGDFRVVVENLPDTYQVKAMTYGSTAIPLGVFRIFAANFPTIGASAPIVIGPSPATQPAAPPANPLDFAAYLDALARARGVTGPLPVVASGTTLRAAALPPSTISITIGEIRTPSADGVRVSGETGSTDKRRVYISGKPGIVFSDGTFEFRGVQPGRHLIASLGNNKPFASVVVVGDQDLNGIQLQETLLLPSDVSVPHEPLPSGDYPPGTIVQLARVTGTVIEETTRTPIPEGDVAIRVGDYTRTVPIDEKGHFETFALAPGTYDLRLQIFGHSTVGPTITVEDKDLTLELTSRRLY